MANQELGGDISGEWELVADFNRVVVETPGETNRSTCLSGNTANLNYPLLADG